MFERYRLQYYVIEIAVLWVIKQDSFGTFHEQAETVSHALVEQTQGHVGTLSSNMPPPVINASATAPP